MRLFAQQTPAAAGPADLTASQKQVIRKVLLSRIKRDGQYVNTDKGHFVDELQFSSVPLSDYPVILVARPDSRQGHNSAYWLFELRTEVPHLIGSPADKLGGYWEDRVLPHTSHGFHDFVLGRGGPSGLLSDTMYRFDGQRYRAIHTERVEFDD